MCYGAGGGGFFCDCRVCETRSWPGMRFLSVFGLWSTVRAGNDVFVIVRFVRHGVGAGRCFCRRLVCRVRCGGG